MEQVTLILDNVRSAHNVGAILRSAAAFGVGRVVTLGITPYPALPYDPRLPHVARKAHAEITKTALGAETILPLERYDDIAAFTSGFSGSIYALEQTETATPLPQADPILPGALILGHETSGVSQSALEAATEHLYIPYSTHKESLNVATAAGIALYDWYLKRAAR